MKDLAGSLALSCERLAAEHERFGVPIKLCPPLIGLIRPFVDKALWEPQRIPKIAGMESLVRAAFLLTVGLFLLGQPRRSDAQSWNKLRYQAGTLKPHVNPFDWNTALTVRSGAVELSFEGRSQVLIGTPSITTLSCGEIAYHRVSDAAGETSSRPVPLFGMVRSDRDHLFGIEFKNADGSAGAVLLLVQRDSFNEVVKAVSHLTGHLALGAR